MRSITNKAVNHGDCFANHATPSARGPITLESIFVMWSTVNSFPIVSWTSLGTLSKTLGPEKRSARFVTLKICQTSSQTPSLVEVMMSQNAVYAHIFSGVVILSSFVCPPVRIYAFIISSKYTCQAPSRRISHIFGQNPKLRASFFSSSSRNNSQKAQISSSFFFSDSSINAHRIVANDDLSLNPDLSAIISFVISHGVSPMPLAFSTRSQETSLFSGEYFNIFFQRFSTVSSIRERSILWMRSSSWSSVPI